MACKKKLCDNGCLQTLTGGSIVAEEVRSRAQVFLAKLATLTCVKKSTRKGIMWTVKYHKDISNIKIVHFMVACVKSKWTDGNYFHTVICSTTITKYVYHGHYCLYALYLHVCNWLVGALLHHLEVLLESVLANLVFTDGLPKPAYIEQCTHRWVTSWHLLYLFPLTGCLMKPSFWSRFARPWATVVATPTNTPIHM